MDAQEILRKSNAAWAIKDKWKSLLTECYDLAFPGVSPYSVDQKNPRTQNWLFDSTAVYSVINLTNRYFNEITPPSGEMADLQVGPLLEMQIGKNQAVEANKRLEQWNKILVMIFQSSSFSNAAWAMWLDYVVAGLGAMLMVEDTKNDLEPFVFEPVSQAEIAVTDGVGGAIDGLSRRRCIKLSQIKKLWDDAIIPSRLGDAKKDPDVKLIESCDRVKSDKGEWQYSIILDDDSAPEIIVNRTYNTCPFIIIRALRMAGCPYGLGKVMTALPDIRTANKVKEMILKNAAMALAGMYLAADDGVLNVDNIQITNGGIIPVARTGGSLGASIVPLETGRGFDVGQIVMDELRQQIKKGLKDSQLPPLDGKVRSATEFIERQKELAQDFGAEIPILLYDLVVALYRRAIDIGARRGILPPLKIDQFALKVTVKTPLARNSDMQEVEKIIQWWQILTMVLGPQMAMAVVKMPDLIPYLSDKIGIPTELYNSAEENQQLQQQVAQAAAAQQMQRLPNQATPQPIAA